MKLNTLKTLAAATTFAVISCFALSENAEAHGHGRHGGGHHRGYAHGNGHGYHHHGYHHGYYHGYGGYGYAYGGYYAPYTGWGDPYPYGSVPYRTGEVVGDTVRTAAALPGAVLGGIANALSA